MAGINISAWATGTLGPGGWAYWFQDDVRPDRARFFLAMPVGGKNYVNRDQAVEITNVYYLQKGTNHAAEGPNVPGEYQVNVVVHNRDPNQECFYGIVRAETDN